MKAIRLLLVIMFSIVIWGNVAVAGIPYVTSTTPVDDATGVGVNNPIVINFSEHVTWQSVNPDPGVYRVIVTEDSSGDSFNSLEYSYEGYWYGTLYKLTLTPLSALKNSTKYKVVVSRYVKGVGFFGKIMAADYTFNFTTESVPDTVPPLVAPSSPGDGAVNVPLDSTIVVQFSEPMNAATVTTSSFVLIKDGSGVSGTVSYDSANNTATFTPSSPLSGGELYTVIVTTDAADLAGNHMAANTGWQFTTLAPDSTPPTIIATTPVSGGTSVDVSSSVKITFSEAMDKTTLTTSTITMNGVSGTVTYDDSGTCTATFTPSASLGYGTDYTMTVSPGVKDLSGNSMTSAKVWTFTTAQNLTPAEPNEYCQVPPFVAGTGVTPNVLLIVDNSGSMNDFAYKTKDMGASSDKSDASYNPNTSYYGYFESGRMYKYNTSGYFEADDTVPLNLTTKVNKVGVSGNMLNWLSMRRVDVVRKILVGGKVSDRSSSTAKLIPLENTDRDYYKSYGGTYYKIDDGPYIKVCKASGCNEISATYSSRVQVDGIAQKGLIQAYAERIRFGMMFFNDTGARYEYGYDDELDGGYVSVHIKTAESNGTHVATLIDKVEKTNPSTNTPLAETFYEGIRYFQAATSAYNSGVDYSGNDPITHSCQRNFVLVLSDGASTRDQNLPGSYFSGKTTKVTDSNGFNIETWMDNIATNEGESSLYKTNPGSQGTYYLAGAAYYAHNTDLRSATVGKTAISSTQNLTTYTVFAFDDSAVGRKNLKLAAKYGGFEDSDKDGIPDAPEWDKNGDSIPDTYYEASQGAELQTALSTAFNDMLTRVSSGTAASILNNSEGSGASLLQAVFYPKKAFENGTEVSWIGEMQNLWYYLDPYLQLSTIRVDTTSDYKLNLKDDNIAQFYFDGDKTRVRLLKDVKGDGTQLTLVGASYDSDDTANVKSLWRAGRLLWSRDLSSDDRTIFTHTGVSTLDILKNSANENTNMASFESSVLKDDTTIQGYLQAANDTEADKIISYVRGIDQSGYRSRTAIIAGASGTWRLGDIVSSTPKIQGNVALNAYHQNTPTGYNDASYKKFAQSNNYRNRGMAYVGANDGMLHAFRMGVLKELTDPCRVASPSADCAADKSQLNDYTVDSSGVNSNTRADASDKLGREEWTFIPRQMLPYLKYLADPGYSHLFYVDGAQLIIDVAINRPATYDTSKSPTCGTNYWACPKQTVFSKDVDGKTTNNLDPANTSWRTILIGGTGLGGASRNRGGTGLCAGGGSDCVKTPVAGLGYSGYYALDITDSQAPKSLWEFPGSTTAVGDMGFATTGPVVIRVGGKSKNGRWFAVFASGPTGPIKETQFLGRSDQNLKLFVVDIATGTLVRTIDTGIANAFAGSLSNSAIDNDRNSNTKPGFYQDDAAYIGYVQKVDASNWTTGGVIRLVTNENVDPDAWSTSTVISGIGPVTTAITKLQDRANKKQWLYFGTGRYFFKNATEVDDGDSQRRLFGIMEPWYNGTTQKVDPTKTDTVKFADLDDQTTSPSSILASGKKGWYINLDTSALNDGYSSERVITDPVASASGVVFFTTFRPTSDVCGYGGGSYIWAVGYATGTSAPGNAMKGKLLVQVSTGAFAEISMSSGFAAKDNRRTTDMIQGVPPKAQGLSILSNPKPIKKIIHYQEK